MENIRWSANAIFWSIVLFSRSLKKMETYWNCVDQKLVECFESDPPASVNQPHALVNEIQHYLNNSSFSDQRHYWSWMQLLDWINTG